MFLHIMPLMSRGSGPPWVHLPYADPTSHAADIPVPETSMDDDEHVTNATAPSSTLAFGSTNADTDIVMAPTSPATEDMDVDTTQRSLRIAADAWGGESTPVKSLTPTQRATPSTHTSTPASSHAHPAAGTPALPPAPPLPHPLHGSKRRHAKSPPPPSAQSQPPPAVSLVVCRCQYYLSPRCVC